MRITRDDLGFHFLTWASPERPDGRSQPKDGTVRRHGIRFSGFEGESANQGDVSRPERSGGRVTTTGERGVTNVSAPTRKENDRPLPPVSDEGGDRRQAGHQGAGERSVRGFAARSRLS